MGISDLFFGYRLLYAEGDARRKLANRLIKESISASEGEDGSFRLSLLSYRRLRSLGDIGVVYSATPPMGVWGFLRRLFPMWGLHVGILVTLLCMFFLRVHVLDVRIEGNETVSDAAILEELASVGLTSGVRWRDLDLAYIESRMLEVSDTVGWLSVNRRALVAYVSVREREELPPLKDTHTPQNLVSRSDAVIEEITLTRGTALVRVGESVAKGALLISGLTEDGALVCAEGVVLGRVQSEVITDCVRVSELSVGRERRLVGLTLSFFNKTLNILKNSSNLPSDCVIIENNSKLTLPFGRTLPISVRTVYLVREHKVAYRMTDEELVLAGERMHREALSRYLSSGELLAITTRVTLTDGGYRAVSTVSSLVDLCTPVPLMTDE